MPDPRKEVDDLMQLLLPSLELAGKDIADYYIALHNREEWALGIRDRIQRKQRDAK